MYPVRPPVNPPGGTVFWPTREACRPPALLDTIERRPFDGQTDTSDQLVDDVTDDCVGKPPAGSHVRIQRFSPHSDAGHDSRIDATPTPARVWVTMTSRSGIGCALAEAGFRSGH
jgi:hypothetical protein